MKNRVRTIRSFGLLVIATILGVTFSCDEKVDFSLDEAPPKLVIEGLVTDRLSRHSIRITRTAPFDVGGEGLPVEDAVVSLSLIGQDESEPEDPPIVQPEPDLTDIAFLHEGGGVYRAEFPFGGRVGRVYKLSVESEGRTIVATDSMNFTHGFIDYFCFRATREPDPDIIALRGRQLYEQIAELPDDPVTDNYYRFKFYTVTRDAPELVENSRGVDVHIASDRLTSDTLTIFPQHYTFYGDSVRMEVYSLSRTVYTYYQDVRLLLENNGDLLSGTPANPLNNYYYQDEAGALTKAHDVLGIFQVSSIREDSLVIGGPESGCCEREKPLYDVDTLAWFDCDCEPGCID